jgi:hypothetical protein
MITSLQRSRYPFDRKPHVRVLDPIAVLDHYAGFGASQSMWSVEIDYPHLAGE